MWSCHQLRFGNDRVAGARLFNRGHGAQLATTSAAVRSSSSFQLGMVVTQTYSPLTTSGASSNDPG
jgi:hypothetical protein